MKPQDNCASEIASAHKPIAFPDARKLSDLFARVDIVRDLHRYKPKTAHTWTFKDWNKKTAEMHLSTFASVQGAENNLDVSPSEAALRFLDEHMLRVDWDTVNFQLVIRGSDTVLVTCDHGKIIGGVWLAIIPRSALPADLFAENEAAS